MSTARPWSPSSPAPVRTAASSAASTSRCSSATSRSARAPSPTWPRRPSSLPSAWTPGASLLHAVDDYRSRWLDDPAMHAMDGLYGQAYHLLDSPRLRAAFDLDAEPASVRDRYGRHRSGQACLLARRLAEAEVPLITVFWNHSGRGQDTRPGRHRRLRLGHAQRHLQRLPRPPAPPLRPEPLGPARRPGRARACSTRPSSSAWASSAAPPGSRSKPDSTAPRPAASTGPACTPSSWPARA